MTKKEITKWIALISVIFGKASVFCYGCQLCSDLKDDTIYVVAIPIDTLKKAGLDWFTKLYAKNGKAQNEIIKGLRELMRSDNSIQIIDQIEEAELIAIKEKYGLVNYGYALEYYYVNKGCKHSTAEDDKTNKRDVYITRYWVAGRRSTRGCQLKCSIRQSSVNF